VPSPGMLAGGAGSVALAVAPLTGPAAPFVAIGGALASFLGPLFGGGGAKKKADDRTRKGYRDSINEAYGAVRPTATAYADSVGGEFGSVIKGFLYAHRDSGADQALGADQELASATAFHNLFVNRTPSAKEVWDVMRSAPPERYQGTGIPAGFVFDDPNKGQGLVAATGATITDAFRLLASQFSPQPQPQARDQGIDPTYLVLGLIGFVAVAYIVRR